MTEPPTPKIPEKHVTVSASTDHRPSQLARYIQHTLIAQDLTREQIQDHLQQCLQFGFDAAMVPGCWVPLARQMLRGTSVTVASAVDFPPGGMSSSAKAAAVATLVGDGAEQIDIGTNVGYLLSGMHAEYVEDIRRAVQAAEGVPLKVMLELPLLPPELRRVAAESAVEAGAAYLKNASAGNVGPATPAEISFLRALAPSSVGVKASGAISTGQRVQELLAAGADLVGTSRGVAIVTGAPALLNSSY